MGRTIAKKNVIKGQVQERDRALSMYEGQKFSGSFDITNLDPLSALSKKGRKKYEQLVESGEVIEGEGLSLLNIRELGLEKDLNKSLRRTLIGDQLFDQKTKTLASQSILEAAMTPDEAMSKMGETLKGMRQQAAENIAGGVDLKAQGLSLAAGRFDDPLAQAVVANANERFGQQQAARGLAGTVKSGAGAFQATTMGMEALARFGMAQMQAGGASAQQSSNLLSQYDPFTSPAFALQREDLAYGRQLDDRRFEIMQKDQHRARKAAKAITASSVLDKVVDAGMEAGMAVATGGASIAMKAGMTAAGGLAQKAGSGILSAVGFGGPEPESSFSYGNQSTSRSAGAQPSSGWNEDFYN